MSDLLQLIEEFDYLLGDNIVVPTSFNEAKRKKRKKLNKSKKQNQTNKQNQLNNQTEQTDSIGREDSKSVGTALVPEGFFDENGNQTDYTNSFVQFRNELIEMEEGWVQAKDNYISSWKNSNEPQSQENYDEMIQKCIYYRDLLNALIDKFNKEGKGMTIVEQPWLDGVTQRFRTDIVCYYTNLQGFPPIVDDEVIDAEIVDSTSEPKAITGSKDSNDIIYQGTEQDSVKLLPDKKRERSKKFGQFLKNQKEIKNNLEEFKKSIAKSDEIMKESLDMLYQSSKLGVKYLGYMTKSLLTAMKHPTMLSLYAAYDTVDLLWKYVMNTGIFLSTVCGDLINAIKQIINNKATKATLSLFTGFLAFSPLGLLMLQNKDLLGSFAVFPVKVIGIVPVGLIGVHKTIGDIADKENNKAKDNEDELHDKIIDRINNDKNLSDEEKKQELTDEKKRHQKAIKRLSGKQGKYFNTSNKYANFNRELEQTKIDIKNFKPDLENIGTKEKQKINKDKKQINKQISDIKKSGKNLNKSIDKQVKHLTDNTQIGQKISNVNKTITANQKSLNKSKPVKAIKNTIKNVNDTMNKAGNIVRNTTKQIKNTPRRAKTNLKRGIRNAIANALKG